MHEESSRICPFCAETIQTRAKVCPRCRQWLSMRSLRHPLTAVLVTGVPHLALYFVLIWAAMSIVGRLFDPRPHYSKVPGALQVLVPTDSSLPTVGADPVTER